MIITFEVKKSAKNIFFEGKNEFKKT